MVHTAWLTAAVFTCLNAPFLLVWARAEDHAAARCEGARERVRQTIARWGARARGGERTNWKPS